LGTAAAATDVVVIITYLWGVHEGLSKESRITEVGNILLFGDFHILWADKLLSIVLIDLDVWPLLIELMNDDTFIALVSNYDTIPFSIDLNASTICLFEYMICLWKDKHILGLGQQTSWCFCVPFVGLPFSGSSRLSLRRDRVSHPFEALRYHSALIDACRPFPCFLLCSPFSSFEM